MSTAFPHAGLSEAAALLVRALWYRDIVLSVSLSGNLALDAPKGALTDEDKAELKAVKLELLAALSEASHQDLVTLLEAELGIVPDAAPEPESAPVLTEQTILAIHAALKASVELYRAAQDNRLPRLLDPPLKLPRHWDPFPDANVATRRTVDFLRFAFERKDKPGPEMCRTVWPDLVLAELVNLTALIDEAASWEIQPEPDVAALLAAAGQHYPGGVNPSVTAEMVAPRSHRVPPVVVLPATEGGAK